MNYKDARKIYEMLVDSSLSDLKDDILKSAIRYAL